MMPIIERRIGAGAMGLSLIEMMFSIFRGHIPDHAVRTASSVAIPPAAIMGVLAAAVLAVGFAAAALWAAVWLAVRLI
jgi:hypothetical protein